MDWIKDRAARMREAQSRARFETEAALEGKAVVANRAPDLWDSVVSCLKACTEQFNVEFPQSPVGKLEMFKLNENSIVIQSGAFPKVILIVNYRAECSISGRVETTISGTAAPKTLQLRQYRFAVDPRLQPFITDDDNRYLNADKVAEELMKPIADFFDEVELVPIYKS